MDASEPSAEEASRGGDHTVLRRYTMRRIGIALTGLVMVWSLGASTATAARIRIVDQCDPTTFNAAGPVLCNPDFHGGVSLQDFQELLTPSAFGHPAWRFQPPYRMIDPEERVHVTNRGGGGQNFSEVPQGGEGETAF